MFRNRKKTQPTTENVRIRIDGNNWDNHWSWCLVGGNGKTLLEADRSYSRRSDCVRAVRRLQWQLAAAEIESAPGFEG